MPYRRCVRREAPPNHSIVLLLAVHVVVNNYKKGKNSRVFLSPCPLFHHRRHRRSRSASSGSEYGGYVPRHRRTTGSLRRDNGRGKAGVSIHDPLGLTKKQELRVSDGKVSDDVPTAAAEVDPAVVQAERQRQAQQWVLQQQAAAFTRIYEQGDDGLGGGNKKNKEIYVGNLLVGVVTADTLKQLFDSSLSIAFPNKENPLVKPVVHVQMASDMKYAFIQLQTEEMASAAIQLNGMELCGRHMTIARPSGWVDPSLAAVVAAKAAKLLLLEKEGGVSAAVVPAAVPSMVAPAPTPAVPQR